MCDEGDGNLAADSDYRRCFTCLLTYNWVDELVVTFWCVISRISWTNTVKPTFCCQVYLFTENIARKITDNNKTRVVRLEKLLGLPCGMNTVNVRFCEFDMRSHH